MKTMFHAFTLSEVLLVFALLALLGGMSIPAYRNYQFRNDLDLAVNQTEQMLNRARLLSQSGVEQDVWGVRVGSGMLFRGSDFSGRNTALDEHYPFAPSITVSGIAEVFFSELYGEPSETGIITFTAPNGDTRSITILEGLGGSSTIILPGEDVRMRIDFDDIKNNGNGSAEAATYVGPSAIRYEDDTWIPIVTNGQVQTDTSLVLDVTGLSVERKNGFVRVLAYGGLENGGKEVVDAYITFEHATVERVENDVGDHACENPFDGVVSNGVGGDEVTQINEHRVFFQTRVTNYGDSILIYWKQEPSRWL